MKWRESKYYLCPCLSSQEVVGPQGGRGTAPERPRRGESLCPPGQQGSDVSKEMSMVMAIYVLGLFVTDAQLTVTR